MPIKKGMIPPLINIFGHVATPRLRVWIEQADVNEVGGISRETALHVAVQPET